MFDKKREMHIWHPNHAARDNKSYHVSIRLPSLNCYSIRAIEYSDSPFANSAELSSQLGQVLFSEIILML